MGSYDTQHPPCSFTVSPSFPHCHLKCHFLLEVPRCQVWKVEGHVPVPVKGRKQKSKELIDIPGVIRYHLIHWHQIICKWWWLVKDWTPLLRGQLSFPREGHLILLHSVSSAQSLLCHRTPCQQLYTQREGACKRSLTHHLGDHQLLLLKKKKNEFYIPQVTCSISVDRCVKDRGSRENPLTHWNPSPSAVRYPRLFYLNATPYPLCRRNWLCYRLRWLPLWWVSACASWLRTKRFKYSLCWQRGPPWVESLWMAEGSRLKKWGALYMKSSVEMKYFDKNFHAKMQLPHFPSIFPKSVSSLGRNNIFKARHNLVNLSATKNKPPPHPHLNPAFLGIGRGRNVWKPEESSPGGCRGSPAQTDYTRAQDAKDSV